MKTNCKNCGAPMDPELPKCPYCGTRYLDLAFDSDKPFYVRMKMGDEIYESKVMMRGIEIHTDYSQLQSIKDSTHLMIYPKTEITLDVNLDLLENEDALMRCYRRGFKG